MHVPGTTYGPGGWQPAQPGGNVAERVVDHGDGTGTRTVYGPGGETVSTETVAVPLAAGPAAPSDEDIEAARAALAAATTIAQTRARALALDELRSQQISALTPPAASGPAPQEDNP